MSPLIWIFLVLNSVLFFATLVFSLNDRLALRWLRWWVKRPLGVKNMIEALTSELPEQE